MHFMVIRRADAGSESEAFPGEPLERAMPDARWLHPSREAVRLHRSAGAWSIEPGPFPAGELAAGFAIIDAPSKEAAIEWARRWPSADAEGQALLEVRETGCSGGCAGIDSQSPPHLTPYAVLIRSSPALEAELPPPPEVIARMNERNAKDAQAGVLLAGDGLKGTAKGARVKFKGGRPTVVDGPFTEIKELIAGFWLIQARTVDEAIAWVKSYPFPWPDVTLELRAVASPRA
ncbi:YciI family protein [Massilia sp. METH4]|uniref:YciI family protein n=1 Tax=Massilia sp. METH4 TaxID=3123041 RepID=UPI0030D3D2C3